MKLVLGHGRTRHARATASSSTPRHKSAQMVAEYSREADKWTKSGLKGVGF